MTDDELRETAANAADNCRSLIFRTQALASLMLVNQLDVRGVAVRQKRQCIIDRLREITERMGGMAECLEEIADCEDFDA